MNSIPSPLVNDLQFFQQATYRDALKRCGGIPELVNTVTSLAIYHEKRLSAPPGSDTLKPLMEIFKKVERSVTCLQRWWRWTRWQRKYPGVNLNPTELVSIKSQLAAVPPKEAALPDSIKKQLKDHERCRAGEQPIERMYGQVAKLSLHYTKTHDLFLHGQSTLMARVLDVVNAIEAVRGKVFNPYRLRFRIGEHLIPKSCPISGSHRSSVEQSAAELFHDWVKKGNNPKRTAFDNEYRDALLAVSDSLTADQAYESPLSYIVNNESILSRRDPVGSANTIVRRLLNDAKLHLPPRFTEQIVATIISEHKRSIFGALNLIAIPRKFTRDPRRSPLYRSHALGVPCTCRADGAGRAHHTEPGWYSDNYHQGTFPGSFPLSDLNAYWLTYSSITSGVPFEVPSPPMLREDGGPAKVCQAAQKRIVLHLLKKTPHVRTFRFEARKDNSGYTGEYNLVETFKQIITTGMESDLEGPCDSFSSDSR